MQYLTIRKTLQDVHETGVDNTIGEPTDSYRLYSTDICFPERYCVAQTNWEIEKRWQSVGTFEDDGKTFTSWNMPLQDITALQTSNFVNPSPLDMQ